MTNKETKTKVITVAIFAAILVAFFALLIGDNNVALLNPKGIIAAQQKSLIITLIGLMLIIVIPVLTATFFISWKYREGNPASEYTPNKVNTLTQQLTLWSFPVVIIFFMSIIMWQSTHKLDPFKPIASANKPITIQVVALQWKWLFIYPEQQIATINFVQFPEQTPINFELTADAPMNSFWIPQLGGQMYSMPGMKTHLNLMATEQGEFAGSAAEISGSGFAGMKFVAKSSSQQDFDQWIKFVKNFNSALDMEAYEQISEPSEYDPVAYYSVAEEKLFDNVMMQFMPQESHMQTHSMLDTIPVPLPPKPINTL